MTLGEQLRDTQDAIQKILKSNISSYKVGEQQIVRNRLKDLQSREEYLIKQIRTLGANYDPLYEDKYFDGKVRIGFE